jgi:hypothetical protein
MFLQQFKRALLLLFVRYKSVLLLFLSPASKALLVFLQQNRNAFDVSLSRLPRSVVEFFKARIAFELFFVR